MDEQPIALIDYLELPAPALEATKAFYTAVFGWEWVDYGPTYAATGDAGIEFALNASSLPGPMPERGIDNSVGPLALFNASDVDAVYSAVVTAAGDPICDVLPYPGGRRFLFADPSGNVLGVYQSDAD